MNHDLVNIGEVIVHGVLFDPKNTEAWRNMDVAENIYRSVPRLFDLLEERGIEYVLVGGIAMLTYVEGRNTQDIDLIISRDDLRRLPEIRVDDENTEFARGWLGELRIDFLFSEGKLFRTVQQKYSTTRACVERSVRCATVEGLLLLKLFALPSLYRQAQFFKVNIYEGDVANLIARYQIPTKPLLDEMATYLLASDMDEIRRIVADIEDRIVRQTQRFSGGSEK